MLKNPYPTELTESIITNATESLLASQYIEYARQTITKGQGLELGRGTDGKLNEAEARNLMVLKDGASALIPGIVRCDVHNANDRYEQTIYEARSESLARGESDFSLRKPFPATGVILLEGYSFVWKMKPDANATLTKANCNVEMDAMSYDDF